MRQVISTERIPIKLWIEDIEDGAMEQVGRVPMNLCKVETVDFKSIFDWEYTQSKVVDYESHPHIPFEIVV